MQKRIKKNKTNNHEKNIFIIGIASIIVSLGIITACNKESTKAESQDSPSNRKTLADYETLKYLVNRVWDSCCVAYTRHSSDFVDACSQSDTAALLSLINTPLDRIDSIVFYADRVYGSYLDNGMSSCPTCTYEVMPLFGERMESYMDIVQEIQMYDLTFVAKDTILLPPGNQCEYYCLWLKDQQRSARYIFCLLNCELPGVIEKNERILKTYKDNIE